MEWDLLIHNILTAGLFLCMLMGIVKKWKLNFNELAISLPWKMLIPIYIGLGIIRALLDATIG